MASGAWRRAWRRHEPLLSDLANGAVYFLKCAGGIYVARRFLVELTCVSVGIRCLPGCPSCLALSLRGCRF